MPTKHRVQMERGCHISGHRDQFLASAGARGRPVRARAPAGRRSAKSWDPSYYAAVCLAGEAGLRVGEVKALRWRVDVDMVAKTIIVNPQMRRGIVGTPKGRTRRTVPMTTTLYDALRALDAVREGYVIRNLPGKTKTVESQLKFLSYRICRRAQLPERGWHMLRHTFGTHAALFGVNP